MDKKFFQYPVPNGSDSQPGHGESALALSELSFDGVTRGIISQFLLEQNGIRIFRRPSESRPGKADAAFQTVSQIFTIAEKFVGKHSFRVISVAGRLVKAGGGPVLANDFRGSSALRTAMRNQAIRRNPSAWFLDSFSQHLRTDGADEKICAS